MELLIEGIAPGGVGYGRLDGRRVYVRRTLPGDRVEVGRIRQERGRQWANLVRVVDRKRDTREAPCDQFGRCGGCAWMDIPYDDQAALKSEMVAEAFRSVGLEPEIGPIVKSPEEFRYRNRVDFAFGNGKDGPIVGLHERRDPRNRSHELPPVCPVTDCWLATEKTNLLRKRIQELLKDSRLRAYNPATRSGVLRSLEVRTDQDGKSILQISVANDKHLDTEALKAALEDDAGVSGLGVKVSRSRNRHAPPKRSSMIFGSDTQTVNILESAISFSGGVFGQVNAFQMERLYRIALDLTGATGSETALDLYCGVGALSVPLARQSGHVTGIELDASAVRDAEHNARANGLDNCSFITADAANVSSWGTPVTRFDRVTVNPPRAGLDPGVVEGIGATRADRVIYVSCNPETLARDCKRLTAHNYLVSEVHPVDMFPQTTHVESVALLERGKGG